MSNCVANIDGTDNFPHKNKSINNRPQGTFIIINVDIIGQFEPLFWYHKKLLVRAKYNQIYKKYLCYKFNQFVSVLLLVNLDLKSFKVYTFKDLILYLI